MKKFYVLLFVIFVFFLVLSSDISAQTPNKLLGMQWHCLQNVRCSDTGANCVGGENYVAGHRIKLKTKAGDLPEKKAPTYIFVCVSTPKGNICTSQNSQLDKKTLGYDGLQKLKEIVKYEPQGVFAPKRTTPLTQKEIESIFTNDARRLVLNNASMEGMEIQDYTPMSLARKWLALNLVPPVKIPIGSGGEQQATFTFEGALSACVPISWDPYGIVFDSQSLEPIPGAQVVLNKKRTNGLFTLAVGDDIPSILNPVTTVEDGAFEFFVPDGTYRLQVNKSGFTFPNKKTLSTNATKIYSDIYRGEDIIQKGAIQHRDIPVDSKTAPYAGEIKVMSYFTMLDKISNIFIIQGRVNYPFATIHVYGKKPNLLQPDSFIKTNLIQSSKANNKGQFELKIYMNKLENDEIIGDIEFIKPDYSSAVFASDNRSKTALLKIEPILNYMEGYAYDEMGKIVTNAKVGVYLELASAPVYETMTDENGFYTISSEFLPPMAYRLQYTLKNGAIATATTSQFVLNNSKFITERQEKLFNFKDKEGNVLEQKTFTNQQSKSGQSDTNKQTTQLTSANILIILSFVLIGIGFVGMGISLYLMKKQKNITK